MTIYLGDEGDNEIHGGKGDDIIYGSGGNDRLVGGLGTDFIVGGYGRDVLRGGANYDRFFFAPGDSGKGSAHRDYIADFQPGVDLVDLETFSHGSALTIEKIGAKALIRIDADHDGRFETQISVAFAQGYSYADFSKHDILIA